MSNSEGAGKLLEALDAEHKEWPPNGNRYFIPISSINRLINEQSVLETLEASPCGKSAHEIDRYAKSICSLARKLFTICLWTPSIPPQTIYSLLDERITDNDLPLTRVHLQPSKHSRNAKHPFTLGRSKHAQCPLSSKDDCIHKCAIGTFSNLSFKDRKDFCAKQWLTLAPVFDRTGDKINHHDLQESGVLPYLECWEKESKIRAGGFGDVWKVRIHPAHLMLNSQIDPEGPLLAVKRLRSTNRDEFQREFNMLSNLTLCHHKHIIKLIATYELGGWYHFLFPFAKANLRAYYKSIEMPYWNKMTAIWVIRQIYGLTSALNAIHDFKTGQSRQGPNGPDPDTICLRSSYGTVITEVALGEERFGRHGDIKPENILWVSDQGDDGDLQLADLGLGTIHRKVSRSISQTKHVKGSPTYMPPEVMTSKFFSRKYDIWSMGCVFLELITWLLTGHGGQLKFDSERFVMADETFGDDTYYTIISSGSGRSAMLRPKVKSWIQDLRQSERCSQAIAFLLELVQHEMLDVNPESRISASELKPKVKAILQTASIDSIYLLGKEPPLHDADLGVRRPGDTVTLV